MPKRKASGQPGLAFRPLKKKSATYRRRTTGTDQNTNTIGGAPLRHGYVLTKPRYLYKELYHAEGYTAGNFATLQNSIAGQNMTFAQWGKPFGGGTHLPGFQIPDGINTGSNSTNRHGASIYLRDLYCRYRLIGQTDLAAGNTQDNIRVICLMDKNGRTDQVLTALYTTTSPFFSTAIIKPQFADEYQVLYDKTHTVNGTNVATGFMSDNHSSSGLFHLKINRVINFQDSTPDLRFYIFFVSDKNFDGTKGVTTSSVIGQLQVTFTQM